MLEGMLVEVYEVIVVVWINKEIAVLSKNIGSAHISFRKKTISRMVWIGSAAL